VISMKIAAGIHRIGDRSIVNAYLLEDGGEVTIIDAGVPGYYRDIPRELAAMGRTIADVRALILTHGHTDHIGFAERLRHDRQVPVSVHQADAALARGEVPNPAKGYGRTKLGPFLGFLWFTLLRGGLRTPKLREVATFGDGATLDVPGSPRVILVPGHTRAAPHFTSRPGARSSSATRLPPMPSRRALGARGSPRSPQMLLRQLHPWPASKRSRRTSCCRGMASHGPLASRRPFNRCAELRQRTTNSTHRRIRCSPALPPKEGAAKRPCRLGESALRQSQLRTSAPRP
jgi:Metallo-beta-lactamase superfamily